MLLAGSCSSRRSPGASIDLGSSTAFASPGLCTAASAAFQARLLLRHRLCILLLRHWDLLLLQLHCSRLWRLSGLRGLQRGHTAIALLCACAVALRIAQGLAPALCARRLCTLNLCVFCICLRLQPGMEGTFSVG